jgi:hypothetical protein
MSSAKEMLEGQRKRDEAIGGGVPQEGVGERSQSEADED